MFIVNTVAIYQVLFFSALHTDRYFEEKKHLFELKGPQIGYLLYTKTTTPITFKITIPFPFYNIRNKVKASSK